MVLMLLALVLPVAPAAVAGEGPDEDSTLTAAHLQGPFAQDATCGATFNDGQTRYFVTLTSTTGSDIPSVNGGTPATVSLLGSGTSNFGQLVSMPVGDLENQAFPGRDNTVPPNGICTDAGDQPGNQADGHVNDYGSPPVTTTPRTVPTTPTAFNWVLYITAAGFAPRIIDLSANGWQDGVPPGFVTPGGQGTVAGVGCLITTVGCLFTVGTVQLTPLQAPAQGRGSLSGIVTDLNGFPLGLSGTAAPFTAGVEVVVFRQPNQDVGDDAFGGIAEGQAVSVLVDAAGQYFIGNLWPGNYSVTVVDTRFPLPCALSGSCGVQPATKQVTVGVGAQVTANFSVPTDMQSKQAPSQTVASGQVGVFGYVIDGGSGTRIGSATPGYPGMNAGGAFPAPGTIIFTPSSGTGGVGSVTAVPDTTGRYQALLTAGVSYTAQVILPPGFTGACTVGGNLSNSNLTNQTTPSTTPLFLCGTGSVGQDRFTFPAAAGTNLPAIGSPTAGVWNDGGSFVLTPSNATLIPPTGSTVVRRLEAVIPGIFRNPDTSYTGVDVETIQVRVVNNGTIRTGAQIEWYSTSSDDVASLVKTDSLDLNPGAVGIFTRSNVPDGCTRCMAQIFSFDIDGPGLVYGVTDLQATVSQRVVDAANALAGANALTFEDIIPTGQTINYGYVLPLVYKNYGGGAHKWNSIITACLTRGVPGAQPVVLEFWATGETRGGPYNITRSTNPGGCLVLNLGTFDPDDPDYFDPLAGLPDGTYAVEVVSTAGLPVPVPPERPGGFFASSLSYTTTGKMAVLNNGAHPLGNEACPQIPGNTGYLNCPSANNSSFRELYGPLLFKRYNDWNSGIAAANFRSRYATLSGQAGGGGGGSGMSVAMYGEDGTLFGIYLDRLGDLSGRIFYMPTLPIALPDGFRGTSIITIGDNTNSTRSAATVMNVNYERNQAMSYNFVRHDQLTGPATPYGRPCGVTPMSTTGNDVTIPPPGATFNTCLSVADVQRRFGAAPRGSAATFEVGLGPTTGVRMFNPDVAKLGTPAFIIATYQDASGVIWTDSFTNFTIPSFGTGTIFVGADARLPDIFDGSMFIQSTVPIAVIAQVVDYRAVDRDGSYAYNVPNQTGQSN